MSDRTGAKVRTSYEELSMHLEGKGLFKCLTDRLFSQDIIS